MRIAAIVISLAVLAACVTAVWFVQTQGTLAPAAPAASGVTVDGHTITAAPGSTVTVETTSDDIERGGTEHRDMHASGTGSGITTGAEKAVLDFNATAPGAWLPTMGSTGGSLDAKATFLGQTKTSPIAWLGLITFVAGIVAFCLKLPKEGVILCAGGVALYGLSLLPAWAFIGVGVLGAAGVGLYVWKARKASASFEAVRSYVNAHDGLPDDAKQALTKLLGAQVLDSTGEKAVISKAQVVDKVGANNPANQLV